MRRMSVKWKLTVALFAVALIPPAFFLGAFLSVLRSHLREDVGSASRAALRAISIQTWAFIVEEPRKTLPTALILAERTSDPRGLAEILRKTVTPRPDFAWMAFLDGDDRLLASYPEGPARPGERYEHRAAERVGIVTFSEPFADEGGRGSFIEACYAGEGRTVLARVDLSGASAKLVLIALSPLDRLGVVDGSGRYVLCSDPSRAVAGERVGGTLLGAGPVLATDEGGRYYVSTASIPGTEWKSIYFRAASEIEALSAAFLARMAILLALAFVGAAAMAFLVWRSVSSPLTALVTQIELVAAGDYASRVVEGAALGFSAEFREIAGAFNAMAESIGRRDREIQSSEERYRLLFNGNSAPALIVDARDGAIRDANPAAVAYYGFGDGLRSLSLVDIDADPPAGGVGVLLERLRDASAHRRSGLPRRHRLGSGETRDVELYVGAIELDGRDHLHAVVFDVTERRIAEERTSAALEEKTLLLREVHHRVKNNLQIITSLLSIQENSGVDPATGAALRGGQDRVQAMALAHELVYQVDDFSSIDLAEYSERLIMSLADAYGVKRSALAFDLRGVPLELDRTIPFGLAVTELATNAFKYAIASGGGSLVSLSLSSNPGAGPDKESIVFIVEDDGPGMPPGISRTGSIGIVLVRSLMDQLSGSATWGPRESGTGTRAALRFPLRKLAEPGTPPEGRG